MSAPTDHEQVEVIDSPTPRSTYRRRIRRHRPPRVIVRHFDALGALVREVRVVGRSRRAVREALHFRPEGNTSGGNGASPKPFAVCTHTADYFCQACSPLGRRRHLAAVRDGQMVGSKPHSKLVLVSRACMAKFLADKKVKPKPTPDGKLDGASFLKTRGL